MGWYAELMIGDGFNHLI